jgi:hypothetical protein
LFGLTGLVPPLGSNDFLCPLLNVSHCHLTEQNEKVCWAQKGFVYDGSFNIPGPRFTLKNLPT